MPTTFDPNSIDSFISGFGGGHRSNRFIVHNNDSAVSTEGSIKIPNDKSFHIRSATLPNSTVGAMPINYRGRTVVYPGERVYTPWQIIIIDDSKNELYREFHRWSNKINQHNTNSSVLPNGEGFAGSHAANNTNDAGDWVVEQLDLNGYKIPGRKFNLQNCWPMEIGDLALDFGADNKFVTFPVTLVYSHYIRG